MVCFGDLRKSRGEERVPSLLPTRPKRHAKKHKIDRGKAVDVSFARKGKAFIYRYTIHEHDRDASCADSTPEALRQRETVVLHEPSV